MMKRFVPEGKEMTVVHMLKSMAEEAAAEVAGRGVEK